MSKDTAQIQGSSVMDLHRGQALLRAANEYPTLREVLLEVVQNAIDAGANRIKMTVSYKTRQIIVQDNGDGTNLQQFTTALSSVGFSIKSADKIGRFGIGLIAPLGKCGFFTFTSCSSVGSPRDFLEWTFRTTDITGQAKNVVVPYRKRSDLLFDPEAAKKKQPNQIGDILVVPVSWRTEVTINDFTPDRHINNLALDQLETAIVQRYRYRMYERNVSVSIRIIRENGKEESRHDIRAQQYQGRKLEEIVLVDQDAGKVVFKLYQANRTTKGFAGTVVVGETEDAFRFPIKEFFHNSTTARGQVNKEVLEALRSGVFEGEITGEKVKLTPSRKCFAYDVAMLGFCTQLEIWYESHGRAIYQEAKEEKRDRRYQDLGLRSIRAIELLLQNPQFKPLREVIDGFHLGTIGAGHAEPCGEKLTGQSSNKVTSASGQHGKRKDEPAHKGSRENPEKDHPGHTPFTVCGPDGKSRRTVRSDSLGIQFCHIPMAETEPLWSLDLNTGTLTFNTNHSHWKACDRSDHTLMQLQEYLTIQALVLHSVPSEWRDEAGVALDDVIPAMVFLLLNSESYFLAGKK